MAQVQEEELCSIREEAEWLYAYRFSELAEFLPLDEKTTKNPLVFSIGVFTTEYYIWKKIEWGVLPVSKLENLILILDGLENCTEIGKKENNYFCLLVHRLLHCMS